LTQKFVLCKLIVFLVFPGALCASVKSNLEVIDSLLTGHFAETTIDMFAEGDTVSILCNLNKKDVQNYILQTVGNGLYLKSITVFRNNNSRTAFEGIVIAINEVIINVGYSAPFNKSPISNARVIRMISVRVAGQIYKTQNGQVLNSLDRNLLYEDEVPVDFLEHIDESPYEFTIGNRLYNSTWDKYFEPLLVMSTIGMVVYLFFSQRF